MTNELVDSQILVQERWSIELLARETHSEISRVQEMYLTEYKNLAAHAHITSYLALLTCNKVRGILESANAAGRGTPEA
jgi:hypothetical protein